jgi:hypothetical protein
MSQNVGIAVTQSGHGFAVGDVIRRHKTNNNYVKAIATTSENAEAVGVVGFVNGDDFVYYQSGKITKSSWGLSDGYVYYLSGATAGALDINEPVTPGYVSKPCVQAIGSDDALVVTLMRGIEIPA